jgi:hypothetical protein
MQKVSNENQLSGLMAGFFIFMHFPMKPLQSRGS